METFNQIRARINTILGDVNDPYLCRVSIPIYLEDGPLEELLAEYTRQGWWIVVSPRHPEFNGRLCSFFNKDLYKLNINPCWRDRIN